MSSLEKSSASDAFIAVKGVCKGLGAYFYQQNSLPYRLSVFLNYICVILQFALFSTLLAYFLRHISEVNKAAECLSIWFPSAMHLAQYFILGSTKSHLAALFDEFENLIDKSA